MKQYTQQPSLLALSPLFIFLGVYLVTSLIADDFYKVPITVAFVISSIAAIAMTRHLGLSERIAHFSGGASDKNILFPFRLQCGSYKGSLLRLLPTRPKRWEP